MLVLIKTILNLILWVPNFKFPIYEFEFRISRGIKFWEPGWGLRYWQSEFSCRKFYIGPVEIASFSKRDFSRSNSMTQSNHGFHGLTCCIDWIFLRFILWTIAVTDFRLLEIYKNVGLPLSTITFIVNSHANNHFYEYTCFKYYTVWNQFFLLKYMLRFFIYRFDFNVKQLLLRKKSLSKNSVFL